MTPLCSSRQERGRTGPGASAEDLLAQSVSHPGSLPQAHFLLWLLRPAELSWDTSPPSLDHILIHPLGCQSLRISSVPGNRAGTRDTGLSQTADPAHSAFGLSEKADIIYIYIYVICIYLASSCGLWNLLFPEQGLNTRLLGVNALTPNHWIARELLRQTC